MSRAKTTAEVPTPLALTLPGLRRYGKQITRLRKELLTAQREITELKARAAAQTEWRQQVEAYEYYWANAFKKIDIRRLTPFGDLAARVIGHRRTYLGVDRLYTLWQLVNALPPEARAIAEVGAYRGGSARFVAEALRLRAREMPFYVCDTFQGHVEVDEAIDGLHRAGQQFRRVTVEKVVRYLAKFPFVRVLPGDIRDTASSFAAEDAFGLVHLDVDVYPITRFCLELFGPRVVVGGTILVDDYGTTTCEGIMKAVEEFSAVHTDFHVIHLLTGQAVLTRVATQER